MPSVCCPHKKFPTLKRITDGTQGAGRCKENLLKFAGTNEGIFTTIKSFSRLFPEILRDFFEVLLDRESLRAFCFTFTARKTAGGISGNSAHGSV